MPLVYIIIVNFNGAEDTLECIESLKKITYQKYKIVVVDNHSKIDDYLMLKTHVSSEVILIRTKQNLGFAGGNNVGIKYAIKHSADFVCLLNNDTVVACDFLDNMIKNNINKDKIGVICPKIVDYYNHNHTTYGGGEINWKRGTVYIIGINEDNKDLEAKSRYITFASGCCSLISSNVIKEVGLLPEDYFLYYEDTEFSVNVLKNYKIWYEQEAVIYHKESKSTVKYSANYQYYFSRNRLMFISRNIRGLERYSAYLFTMLYLFKKLLTRKFCAVYIFEGVKDFVRKKYGKRQEH